MQPCVSVIIPSYNYAWCIRRAIDSVVQQSFTNWELIIVDDGSKDESVKVIEKYCNAHPSKIKLLTHPSNQNRGIAQTYQLGALHAKGQFLAFLEADDYWEPNALQCKIPILRENDKVGLVFSKVRPFHCDFLERIKCEWYFAKCRYGTTSNKAFTCKRISQINVVPTFSCVMVRKAEFLKLDFNPPKELQAWLDWWLWAQLAKVSSFFFVPIITTHWMRHKTSYNQKVVAALGGNLNRKIRFFRQSIVNR